MGAAFNPPENIGDAINSPFSDLDPTLSMDGFRLHFSSNRALPPTLPAASQDPATAPAVKPGEDYGVWVSHSREVYRLSEASQASFGDLLWSLLPWLLLLLLALLLALILPRLWIDQRMKARFRRLSLLAQCLLVSLALHVLIASLLALWKVGSHISHIIADAGGGGGHRVILASSSGDGDGFAMQLRGELTSESGTPDAPDLSAAALATAALESAQVRTDAAPTRASETARAIDTPESLRADAQRPSELAPTQAPERQPEALHAATPASTPAPAALRKQRPHRLARPKPRQARRHRPQRSQPRTSRSNRARRRASRTRAARYSHRTSLHRHAGRPLLHSDDRVRHPATQERS